MKKYLIVHFGDFESLVYQTAVINSIFQNDKSCQIDLLLTNKIKDQGLIANIKDSFFISDSYWKNRRLLKSFSNQYNYIINMHRGDYKASLKVIKKIKSEHKIGYNMRRKINDLEISKEKKGYLIDHYLKVCDLLKIDKIRELSLTIANETGHESMELLIDCTLWPFEKIEKLVSMPLLRLFKITICATNEGKSIRSWNKITFKDKIEDFELVRYSVVISDSSRTKTLADALKINCIYLLEQGDGDKSTYPIIKNSYAIVPRMKKMSLNEIELDAVAQALKWIIEESS